MATMLESPARRARPAAVTCHGNFSIREARRVVQDLFEPDARVYWADFLISITIAYVAYGLVAALPAFSVWQVAAYVVACLAIYRAALFTHELVHLKGERFLAFRFVWNALCGVPFLMPSFTYYTHVAHHSRKHYGTTEDGEYLPLGAEPAWHLATYLTQPFYLPLAALLRFAVFSPIAWASPGFRRFVRQRMSSMIMDPSYVRPLPTEKELRYWRVQEVACFVFAMSILALLLTGALPWTFLLQAYAIGVGVLGINHIRTMGAHRFTHTGEELSFVDQLLDSVNYPNHAILSELWAPVGLRFHALHHLFPSMPYHSLAEAHRRLMRELPADSPYRQTVSPGLTHTLYQLWRNARAASRAA